MEKQKILWILLRSRLYDNYNTNSCQKVTEKIMEETFEARKLWIQHRLPPIRVVMAKFPPLKDTLSCHFQKEFARLQPDAASFIEGWEQIAPIIVEYSEQRRDNSDVASLLDELKSGGEGQTADVVLNPSQGLIEEYAVHLLPHVLRPPFRKGRSRSSTKEVADTFIRVLPTGTPVESAADAAGQPLLFATGARGSLAQTFILLEGHATQVPSLLAGVDKAFKTHYLFNVAYNEKSVHVWQLVQKLVYKIQDDTTTYACVHDFQAYSIRMKNKRPRPES